MATKEWESLSTKAPSKEPIKRLVDEQAMQLLEIMVKDSAFEFEGGVDEYIKSERALKKARLKLNNAIISKCDHATIWDMLIAYDEAIKRKQRAVRNIKSEYLFMTCERDVKPPIDGVYVMKEIIKQLLKSLNEEEYEDLLESIKEKTEQK